MKLKRALPLEDRLDPLPPPPKPLWQRALEQRAAEAKPPPCNKTWYLKGHKKPGRKPKDESASP